MNHVLIISGHTDLKTSVANKTILDNLANLLPEARIVKLDECYPDFRIDAEKEQANLLWADIVILQFPIFWYSAPSLLERWMEETFRHGFSHGSAGDKLKGKRLVLSYTSGAPAEMYSKDGAMGHDIGDYLLCFRSACALTQMVYAGDVFTGGVSYANRTTPQLIDAQKAVAADHAKRLAALIGTL